MTQKSEQTKARILRAATEEFARYGIAGARVDRIAAAAEANKNLIYMYFGSKDRLFDEVCEAAVEALVSTVPFDAHDLPGYAGKLFDFYRAHPELLRLARWQALERPEPAGMPGGRAATEVKLRELAKAQAEGVVDAGMPPESLLTLVLNLSAAWSDGSVEGRFDQEDPGLVSARRHWVVVSVGRLTRPPDPQAG
jgi:AcrR family transcriptional regulator